MIWFIIGFVVFVVLAICICADTWNDLNDKIIGCIATFLLSSLVSALVCLLASVIMSCFVEVDYSEVSDTKIITLKDNQNMNGNFYIFSGHVEEDLYYYYATETELGYKTEKVKANNAYIKYTDGETHIEKHMGKFANNIANIFGFPMYNDRYIIYCPEGTITNEFNVDLE